MSEQSATFRRRQIRMVADITEKIRRKTTTTSKRYTVSCTLRQIQWTSSCQLLLTLWWISAGRVYMPPFGNSRTELSSGTCRHFARDSLERKKGKETVFARTYRENKTHKRFKREHFEHFLPQTEQNNMQIIGRIAFDQSQTVRTFCLFVCLLLFFLFFSYMTPSKVVWASSKLCEEEPLARQRKRRKTVRRNRIKIMGRAECFSQAESCLTPRMWLGLLKQTWL